MNVDIKFEQINKLLLRIIPSMAVVGILLPLAIKMPNLSLLGLYLGIPMLLSSIIYTKQKRNMYTAIQLNEKIFILCMSFYLLFLSYSIVVLKFYEVRPYLYYLIIVLMSTIVLSEILLFEISEKKVTIILLQIMILILNILWGVTLKYPLFISRTDPLGHIWIIQSLINENFISDTFDVYKAFPLWHILCASISKIMGVQTNNKVMYFANGIVYSFMAPIMYYITEKVFKDRRIALLATLFMAVYPENIIYGMASIPRSVVTFLELMLIMVLLNFNKVSKALLSIIIMISIVLYHTVSIPFIYILFAVIYTAQKIFKSNEKSIINLNYMFLTIIFTFFYWMYHANTLLELLIKNIVGPAPSGVLSKSILYTPLSELFNYMQYSLLLLFLIVGVFKVLDSKKVTTLGKIFSIIGLISIIFAFPGPTLLVNKLSQDMNFGRFAEYTYIFISLIASIGFLEIYLKSKKNMKILIIILFMCTTLLSISNDFSASDNPLVKRPFYTYYLSDDEITAFDHIGEISKGYIMSDYVPTRYFMYSPYNNKSHILEVNSKGLRFLRNNSDDVILIRKEELKKRPLKLYSSAGDKFKLKPSWNSIDYYYNDLTLWNNLRTYNLVYESNNVQGYC